MTAADSGNAPSPAGGGEPAAEFHRVLTIRNRRGLHARASARFVQTAERFDAQMIVERDGLQVGGQSIMGLMMLAASQGAAIAITTTGREAEAAMDAIAALVADGFGEEC